MQTSRVIVCQIGRFGELRKILDTNLSQLQDRSKSSEDFDLKSNIKQTEMPRDILEGEHSSSVKIASGKQNLEKSRVLKMKGKVKY